MVSQKPQGTKIAITLSKEMKENELTYAKEDKELVRLCKKGDIDAFEELMRKHQKRVFNIAYRMVGNYEEASDIAQETFISAYRGIEKFKEKSRFSTWLHTITINTAKNRLIQLKNRQAREAYSIDDPIDTPDGKMPVEPTSNDPSILERLEVREVAEKVQICIDSLEPEFKEVIVLRDIQGLTYGEIADVLTVPEGTVKSRLFRARDSLKERLKNVLGEL